MTAPGQYNPSTPRAAQGIVRGILTGSTLPVSGVYLRSDVVNTQGNRRASVFLDVTAKLSGNQVSVIPLCSNDSAQPSITASTFYTFGSTDGTYVTGSLSSGVLPSDTGLSFRTKYATATQIPLRVSLATAVSGTQRDRVRIDFDVSSCRWFQVLIAENGVTGSATTTSVVTASVALST